MTLVLSLNDHGLTIGGDSGILARSQGSVVESDDEVLFGQEAVARSRLYPVTFNNRFWHELGMEPLPRSVAHFRHHADIAHAHLLHLAQQADLDPGEPVEVMVLLPGTFSREQLGTLLGIMQHTPFRPVTLVDIGAMAGAITLEQPQGLHVDMQLHQMVVTGLQRREHEVRQEKATAVPDLGWHQLEEALAGMVTDAFIRQARFNPRHDAHWEQRLHDRLPGWLQQAVAGEDNLVMLLETSGVEYRASLARTALEQRLRTFYGRLSESMQMTPDRVLVLAERCTGLPGLRDMLQQESSGTVNDEQLIEAGLSVVERLRQEAGQPLRFVRTVPLQQAGSGAVYVPPSTTGEPVVHATHVLSGHEARPLADGSYCCVAPGGALVLRADRPENDERVLGEIRAVDGHFSMCCRAAGLLLNDRPCAVGRDEALRSGDRLQTADDPRRSLQLIRVSDG